MYELRFAQRSSGRYPADEFLTDLKVKSRDSYDKFLRVFETFTAKGPDGITGLYKALQGQNGIVQFTIWKYRLLGFRDSNTVFLTNGFKKDRDDTLPQEIARAHAIRVEHIALQQKKKKKSS